MRVIYYYHVHVHCVDGETYYSMGSFQAKRLLQFLEKYDHEGSSLSLDVRAYDCDEIKKEIPDLKVTHEDEAVYELLRRHAS